MPSYKFQCKKCKKQFQEICSFSDYDAGFPDIRCPECKSKSLKKNILTEVAPELIFANPRESSKWNKWSYRQGKTWEEAKICRANAEAAAGVKNPYKTIDDTRGGRRMNFID